MKEYYIIGTPIRVVERFWMANGNVAGSSQAARIPFWSCSLKKELRSHLPKGEVELYLCLDDAITVARKATVMNNSFISMPPVFKVAIDEFSPLEFKSKEVHVPKKNSDEYFIHACSVSVEFSHSHMDVLTVLSGFFLLPNHIAKGFDLNEISLIDTRFPNLASPKTIISEEAGRSTIKSIQI